MKWVLTFALVSILTVACSGAAPTYTPVPTVNVDAMVESAIEATKPKPRWDVHLQYIGDWAGILAEILRPLIAGRCGSGP